MANRNSWWGGFRLTAAVRFASSNVGAAGTGRSMAEGMGGRCQKNLPFTRGADVAAMDGIIIANQ
jgi:hypothetical protein